MWLKSGRIFDANTGEYRNADILVEDGRIADVARAPNQGAEVVDLDGRYLFPGFIDCHVHICVKSDNANPHNPWRDVLPGTIAIWGVRAAKRMLHAGVTTAREVGGWDYHEIAVRDAIDAGWIEGPRLFCSGRILTITSSTTPYFAGMYEEADGPEAVRAAARKQFAKGANLIKILASGSLQSSRYERADAIQYRPDEIRAAVEIAEDNFTHVAAHAHANKAIRNAVECGCHSIEHGTYGSADIFDLMVERGTYLVPTLCTTPGLLGDETFARDVPPHIRERKEKAHKIKVANLKLARERGVKVAMGSDVGAPGCHCGDNLFELEVMVEEAGYQPVEAIRSATLIAAELMGLEKELGSLEIGKRADVVAFTDDPLNAIGALRRPIFVMKDGAIVRNE